MQCVPGRLSQEPFNPVLPRALGDGTVLPRDPLCPSVVKDFSMQSENHAVKVPARRIPDGRCGRL